MPRGWFKTYNLYCGLNTESVDFKVDKGADADVLLLSQARSLSAPIISSEARLRSYSGYLLPSGGKLRFVWIRMVLQNWNLSWWMRRLCLYLA